MLCGFCGSRAIFLPGGACASLPFEPWHRQQGWHNAVPETISTLFWRAPRDFSTGLVGSANESVGRHNPSVLAEGLTVCLCVPIKAGINWSSCIAKAAFRIGRSYLKTTTSLGTCFLPFREDCNQLFSMTWEEGWRRCQCLQDCLLPVWWADKKGESTT